MRFQVPQYIDVEDKIGALTFKQYIYIGGSVGLSVVSYFYLPFIIAIILIVPILSFGAALAFYQHNNRPFIFLVESFFYYLMGDKLYVWKKLPPKTPAQRVAVPTVTPLIQVPRITTGGIHDLSVKLDIKENEDERIEDRV